MDNKNVLEKNIYSCKTHNGIVEICEVGEEDVTGRVKIKMSSHKIHIDENSWNKNGITWLKKYTENNIKSAIGMNYVVSWADEENQIPSDHGNMSFDEDGNVQFDGVVVGSVQEVYLAEIENEDGEMITVMMTEGYINSQRYPLFVKWLKEELINGKVHGSIEINGKAKNKTIEYVNGNKNEDGTLKEGRIPKIFDFTGLAILSSLVEPADNDSVVVEINEKSDEVLDMKKVIKTKQSIEINELSVDDIALLVTKAFNRAMQKDDDGYYHCSYYIHRLYPKTGTVIMRKWDYEDLPEYCMTSYILENSKITLSDIVEVEESWSPKNNEESVEVNATKIQEIIKNMEVEESMDNKNEDKIVLELNQKLETKAVEINGLTEKVTELNEALTNANKMLQECNEKMVGMEEELNGYKEMAMKVEKEKKEAEVNEYFNTEIPKNKFEEVEVNELKVYVESCDLDGLKKAESELCTKKLKALMQEKEQKNDTEINSKNESMFISIKNKDKKEIGNQMPTFFE